MSKFVASFSAIQAYETCPLKYYHERVTKKYEQPKGEAAIWGDEVHKKLEAGINTGTPLPQSMAKYQPILDTVMASPGEKLPEVKLAVTKDLQPCDFFAPDAWLRGICDLLVLNGYKAGAFDWKTGKKKKESSQLDIMACLTMARYPEVEYVVTSFVWLQEPKPTRVEPKLVDREELPELFDGFASRISDIEYSYQNNVWPARPSGLCKQWCPVRECPHNGHYRIR